MVSFVLAAMMGYYSGGYGDYGFFWHYGVKYMIWDAIMVYGVGLEYMLAERS